MRPIELKIKGINSYREEQVINFNQLTSQGFFGIFGPTGSGKSTILDAITLALYAKLPRGSKILLTLMRLLPVFLFISPLQLQRQRNI
ncbi:AAA family ATPase [Anaerobutyricum hallii]|nr:AAA family ATPase [Anaerobutyricum hallii]